MNRQGKNNSNWKGGISKDPERKRIQANLSNQKYYRKNKGKISKQKVEYNKTWRKLNPDLARLRDHRHHIKTNYGLTEEQFEKMLINCRNRCEICHKLFRSKEPFIDHDHNLNKVKGLLCSNCNFALGLFGDLEVLERAISYLGRNQK